MIYHTVKYTVYPAPADIRAESKIGEWKIREWKHPKSKVRHWTIGKEIGRRVLWFENDAGRAKRFHSEESAKKALEKINT